MTSLFKNLVFLTALTISASSLAQVVIQPSCSSQRCGNTDFGSSRFIVESIHSNGKLDQMIRFIDSLSGKVDYYTYGEVFLPIKIEIASVKTITAVYGPAHQQTLVATLKMLKLIDSHWDLIGGYKNTDMFFETINYFELILLQLKRDTYL